jgi:hypothetical protein
MRVAIVIWLCILLSGAASAQGSQFPVAGLYSGTGTDVTGRFQHDKFARYMTPENFQKLIVGPGLCSNKHVSIGSYSFDVISSCDTPDRDIRGIPTHRYGTFSPRSFTMTEDLQLFGKTVTTKAEFELVRAMPRR